MVEKITFDEDDKVVIASSPDGFKKRKTLATLLLKTRLFKTEFQANSFLLVVAALFFLLSANVLFKTLSSYPDPEYLQSKYDIGDTEKAYYGSKK